MEWPLPGASSECFLNYVTACVDPQMLAVAWAGPRLCRAEGVPDLAVVRGTILCVRRGSREQVAGAFGILKFGASAREVVFSSPIFLFFFLPALLSYFLVPERLRNLLLLGASLIFYAWGEQFFVFVMLLSILTNYGFGLLIDRVSAQSLRWKVLAAAIAANLSLLIICKYANFLVNNLNQVLVWLGRDTVNLDPIHLPIGISVLHVSGDVLCDRCLPKGMALSTEPG